MLTLLMSLAVIAAVLLIIVVLLQASKGSGLAGTFGGAQQMGTMFGTRRTADFLSKATWWLAGSLVVLALLINLFFLPSLGKEQESIIQKSQNVKTPAATAPRQAK